MNVLLDTNAYTALARGEQGLLRRLAPVERLLMSAIVVGDSITVSATAIATPQIARRWTNSWPSPSWSFCRLRARRRGATG